MRREVADDLMAGRYTSPLLALNGTLINVMEDAIRRLMTSLGYVIADPDDEAPGVVRVVRAPEDVGGARP